MRPFHLAIPAKDLKESEKFYTELFECQIGRRCDKWIDFNFYGHQLSIHLKPNEIGVTSKNKVDGKNVPVRHFGIILKWNVWHDLAKKLKKNRISFIINPYIRFKNEVGEQATMFFLDPSGNALEFKSFKDMSLLFCDK